MKKHNNLVFYLTTLGIFFSLIFITLKIGKENLEKVSDDTIVNNGVDVSAWGVFLENLMHSLATPTVILIGQLIVILIVVKLFGWLCKLIGQTAVIGEIIAGVILGPSFFGYYFPELSATIFPASSLGNIGLLSQVGLILFMFIIGMELDLKTIKNKAENAVVISHASIVFPFTLGVVLAYFIYEEFTHAHVSFLSFALFMGIAMSITAFPVLARIIHERGINKQSIGPVVITCAAVDDVTAWCLLAAVIAIVKADSLSSSFFVILLAVTYIVFMFKVVRPVLKRVVGAQESRKDMSKSVAATFFIMLFISAYITELIGIHALFGAFLAGVMMPNDRKFRNLLIEKIEYVSLIVLLPLFFVYTGLRTEIGLLNSVHLWGICGLIILVAITGKFWGSAIAARYVGVNWKDSLTIGALMNTRGLMELVVLNIGLDLGILSPEIFAMMVIMALVTTFMTSPSLNVINKLFKKKDNDGTIQDKKFKILIPFASSESGKKLLKMACFISTNKHPATELTVLHASEGNFLHQYNVQEEEALLFKPLEEEAEKLNREVNTIFNISNHSEKSIVRIANKGEYDFVLIGSKGNFQLEKNMLGQFIGISRVLANSANKFLRKLNDKFIDRPISISPFEDRTRYILSKVDTQVGIFIDRGVTEIQRVLVPILDEDDVFIGEFLEKIAENARITLWDKVELRSKSLDFVKPIDKLTKTNPYTFLLWNNNILIDDKIFQQNDLIIISLRSWEVLKKKDAKLVETMPSTLILTPP